jgi:hypothetical protein
MLTRINAWRQPQAQPMSKRSASGTRTSCLPTRVSARRHSFSIADCKSIENLQVSFSAFNPSGERVATGTLEIANFGNGSADRYADAFAESEHFCDDDLTIVVDQATAIIEGKQVDLLAQKVLVPEEFKPFKILSRQFRH